MEDPRSEWEIEEYYPSEDGQSKVSWILNKGLGLGKKIVITGILISSAPLVLPPLVIISALGFAVSVPFGLVFASYACTEKLMRKLLPSPEPPLILGYGKNGEEDVGFGGEIDMEKEEEDEKAGVGFGGDIDMEKEEEDEKAGTKGGVEMRIELVENESQEFEPQEEVLPEYKDDYGLKGIDKHYEEENVVKIEGMGEEGEGEMLIEESKDKEVDELVVLEPRIVKESGSGEKVIGKEVVMSVEEINKESEDKNVKLEKLVREDEAIPKEIKEEEELAKEGNVDNGVKEDEMLGAGERDKNVSNVEMKNVKVEKFNRKKKGRKGKKGAEALPNKNEMPERSEENTDIVQTEVKPVGEVEVIIHENEDENNADNVLAVERTYGDSNGRRLGGVVQSIEEEQKPLVDNKSVMQGEKAKDQVVTDVHGGLRSETEKENTVYKSAKENENVAVGIAEILELPVSAAGVPKSKHAGISSEMAIAIPSNQVLLSEEKIWEQMDAMRTIVGYKAGPQLTCLEELKALYIFTGVEPPASFKDPSDLAEVNLKLRFLMSIVGVK